MNATNYRFRCETADDFGRFVTMCHRRQDAYLRVCNFRSDGYGGDAEVASNLTLEEIRGVMRMVPDGHVMVQTVAESEEYTGDRDFDVSTEIEYPTQVDCRMYVAVVELRELLELGDAILNAMADDVTIRFRILEARATSRLATMARPARRVTETWHKDTYSP